MKIFVFLLFSLFSITPVAADEGLTLKLQAQLAEQSTTPAGEALLKYYREHAYRPIWIAQGRVSPKLESLLGVIEQVASEGLRPGAYSVVALRSMRNPIDQAGLARLEVTASLAALRLATDLQAGRLAPRLVDPDLFIQPRPIQVDEVMNAIRTGEDMGTLFAGWAPASREYGALRDQLALYRRTVDSGGWPKWEAGPTLKPGLADERIPLLRRRLAAEGYATGEVDQQQFTQFDSLLATAVEQFQRQHGLSADGVVGQETQAALAVTAQQRLRQIELSMERLRWMPDDLGKHHIRVNIAAFELALVLDGKPVLEMPVAVGRPYRRTPVFTGRMTYLEFNPTWTVPPTILRNDMLPKLRKNASALKGDGFRLFDGYGVESRELDMASVDWQSVPDRAFPYRLRQDPGPKNALGRVKFMLPNPHNIYLHDTPDHSVFQKTQRAFSSGCIRLARPGDLAEALLARQLGWTRERVDAAMTGKATQQVRLPEPLPVHLTYMTAWVATDGKMQFRNDIYGRDKRLDTALSAR